MEKATHWEPLREPHNEYPAGSMRPGRTEIPESNSMRGKKGQPKTVQVSPHDVRAQRRDCFTSDFRYQVSEPEGHDEVQLTIVFVHMSPSHDTCPFLTLCSPQPCNFHVFLYFYI